MSPFVSWSWFCQQDVGFIQMLKPVSGVGIFLLLVMAGKEKQSWPRWLTMMTIVGGITVSSVGNEEVGSFNWIGFTLVTVGSISYALYMVGSQLVLQDSAVKLDPVSQLLIVGPVAAVSLAVVAAASEWNDSSFTFSSLPWYVSQT